MPYRSVQFADGTIVKISLEYLKTLDLFCSDDISEQCDIIQVIFNRQEFELFKLIIDSNYDTKEVNKYLIFRISEKEQRVDFLLKVFECAHFLLNQTVCEFLSTRYILPYYMRKSFDDIKDINKVKQIARSSFFIDHIVRPFEHAVRFVHMKAKKLKVEYADIQETDPLKRIIEVKKRIEQKYNIWEVFDIDMFLHLSSI